MSGRSSGAGSASMPVPYRQIRAHQDPSAQTLTVYAAFSNSIAQPALDTQKLDASPQWRAERMTWVKPSWSWMMYRCGYGSKDPRQERVLALEMRVEDFTTLLGFARVDGDKAKEDGSDARPPIGGAGLEKEECVQVQWDPERSPGLKRLDHRSIQIGIPGRIKKKWVDEWIVSIKDVTGRARALKAALEKEPGLSSGRLVQMGLVPTEEVVELAEELREQLRMN